MHVLKKILEEIETARQEPLFRLCDYSYKDRQERIINRIEDIIRSHMHDDRWIPVEEHLPEARVDCLVSVKYSGFMGMHGTWIKTGHVEGNADKKWWGDCIGGEVIAWRPLPEPFRKER